MFDNIKLIVNNLPLNYSLCDRVKNLRKRGINDYEGNLENMGIYKNQYCLKITGSLSKYLNGENITPLTREGVKQSIKKLEQNIGLSLKNAIVCSVEFGTSIILKYKPFEYLNLFGHTKILTRVEYSKWTGVETINYSSKTGSFEFIGYNKIKEMLDKKQVIPSFYNGLNILRLEYKIRAKKGIEAKFKSGLTAYNLFNDENVYSKFKDLFFNAYKNICKMGQLVYTDKSKEITPSIIRDLLAEQYRQSHPKEYRYFIQQLIEDGKLSPVSLARIRAENNKLGKNYYILEQGALIKELDAFVYDRMKFGV